MAMLIGNAAAAACTGVAMQAQACLADHKVLHKVFAWHQQMGEDKQIDSLKATADLETLLYPPV